MSKLFLVPALILFVLAANPAFARGRGEDDLRRDMEFARRQVYPALVNISVVVKVCQNGKQVCFSGAGSGVIVSPAGHVLTNFHVAGSARRISCRLPSGEEIPADVLVHDPLTDLSILKLRMSARKDRNKPLPFARIGDSDALEIGDYVLAMGNPMTLSSSMTLGIVSNPNRVMLSFSGNEMEQLDLGAGQYTGLFTRWIQHDALIAPGNSGGPLVNLDGEVIGINELGGSGMGFAIPSNLARSVLNQALAQGEVVRGSAGITLYPSGPSGDERGVIISDVAPGGPAEAAGLRGGDRLLRIDGVAADAPTFECIPVLYGRIAELNPGRTVEVVVERNGQPVAAVLKLTRMRPFLADEQEVRSAGLTVRDVTEPMARRLCLPTTAGVLVTGVRPGHPAERARPAVAKQDLVTHVNGEEVTCVTGLREALRKAADQKTMALTLLRGEESLITVLETDTGETDLGGGELQKGWIGVSTQPLIPTVARALGVEGVRGLRITRVHPGSAAETAGLRTGDIVLELNDHALPAVSPHDQGMLDRLFEQLPIESLANLTVLRGGEKSRIAVKVEESPASAAAARVLRNDFLEFSGRDLTFADRLKLRLNTEAEGVLVTDVANGGWAALGGLHFGDLILRIGDHEIRTVADLEQALLWIEKERPSHIGFFVRRSTCTTVFYAEPEYEDLD